MDDFIKKLRSMLDGLGDDAIKELKELNILLTDISRSNSKLSNSDLDEIGNHSISTAGKYGRKPADYLTAVLEASKEGYKNATQIADLSLATQAAGNLSAELANGYITAMDSAYKFEGSVEELTEVLDGTNNIANKNAISLMHLVEGMSAAGSQAASLGLEAGETTALLGTMTAATNQSGKEMAEALKTILLYLGQVTDEGKGISAESLVAYENACLALNVSLRETRNGVTSLRSPMEIIKDLADEYSHLTSGDSRKINLLNSIGGGTNAEALDALLDNYDLYSKMTNDYSHGIGSLSSEAEKAADSWEGSLNRLSSTWTGTFNNIIKSDGIASVANSLNFLLTNIRSITDSLGPLGSLGLLAGLKNVGFLRTSTESDAHTQITTKFGDIKNFFTRQERFSTSDTAAIRAYNAEITAGTAVQTAFQRTMSNASDAAKTMVQNANGNTIALRDMTTASKAATMGMNLLATAGNMITMMAIGKLVEVVVTGLDNLINSAEHCKERADEAMDSYLSTTTTIKDNARTASELAERYDELSKGVGSLGNNISLTKDEFEEYHNITSKIAELYPSLVSGWDEEGNAIVNLKDSVKELNSEYEKSMQAANLKLMESKDDITQNYMNIVKDTTKHIEEAEILLDKIHSGKSITDIIYDDEGVTTTYYGIFKNLGMSVDDMIHNNIATIEKQLTLKIQSLKSEIEQAAQDITPLFMAYLSEDTVYQGLTNKELKSAVSMFVNTMPATLVTAVNEKGAKAGSEFITGFVQAVADNSDAQEALIKLPALDLSGLSPTEAKETVNQYVSAITDTLNSVGYEIHPSAVRAEFGFEDVEITASNYNTILNKAASKFATRQPTAQNYILSYNAEMEALTKFAEENSINTQDEIAFWNKCIEESGTREDAMQLYLKSFMEPPKHFSLSAYQDKTDSIQSTVSTLRSALDSLNSGNLDELSVIDLLQQFPSLALYIDLTAKGFGQLSEGLSNLIEQQPEALIQELGSLKSSLSTQEERHQLDLLMDSLQRLGSYGDTGMEAYAASIGNTWNDTTNVINGVTTQFEALAKVQEAVARGLSMTTTQAAELAKAYPEILTGAILSADGQITLNEEVVNSILEGDQSILQSQITKLETDRAELTARKAYAEAQLNIMRQVGEGQGQITRQTAQYRLDTAKQQLENMLKAGATEEEAYAAVAESMAGNTKKLNNLIGIVCQDIAFNSDNAFISMAETADANSQNAQKSMSSLQLKMQDVAETIVLAGQGLQGGRITTYEGGGSSSRNKYRMVNTAEAFNSTLSGYQPKDLSFQEFQSQLEIDIQEYTDAISNIDSQIAVLRSLQNTFENHGGIGGHGYGDKIAQLEKEKELLKDTAKEAAAKTQEAAETFNWLETALSRVQRAVKNFGSTVSATWKNWTERNTALNSQLAEVRNEISLQQTSYENYMQKAESVGLSDYYKDLVAKGGLSIENITDSTLKEQIKTYQEWYEKALGCADAVSDLQDKLAELAKTKFDSITAQYEAKTQDIDHTVNLINGELEKAEALNQIAGESFYHALIDREQAKLSTLEQEYSEKLSALREAVFGGSVETGSQAWQDMKADIDSVTESIQKSERQLIDYEKSLRETAAQKFDSLEKQFENAVDLITSEISQADKQLSLIEEAGYMAEESFYRSLIEAQKANVDALAREYSTLSSSFAEALDSGSITQFDENWYQMTGSINSVEDALLSAQEALLQYGNSLKQLQWDVFDRMQESMGELTEESNFLLELMGKDSDLYNPDGSYSAKGLTAQGLHAVSYEVYMRQAQEYAKALREINGELAADPGNMKLTERYRELLKLQRETVLNAEDEKSAIKDLVSGGYDQLLSHLDQLISARKDALSREKDLHDYEKTISKQTDEVEKYQKLLTAYEGDDSESMKVLIQKAQEGLTAAQEELSETEYDRYMSDQEALLDTFRGDVEEWIGTRLDDISQIMAQAIEATNQNARTISGQLNTSLSAVGMNLTENFARIFETDYSGGVRDIVSGYYEGGGRFDTAVTTLGLAMDSIRDRTMEVKMSADGISAVLNQRFPELAAAIPSLDTTNGKIGDVKSAVDLVRQALETVNVTLADLHLKQSALPSASSAAPVPTQTPAPKPAPTPNPSNATAAPPPSSSSGLSASGQSGSGQSGSGQSGSGHSSPGQSSSGQNGSGQSSSGQNGSGELETYYAIKDSGTGRMLLKNATKAECSSYILANNLDFQSLSGGVFLVRKKATATTPDQNKTKYTPTSGSGGILSMPANLKTLHAYAEGLHKAPRDETAWTQENGPEILVSPSRNSILTTIKRGDSVLTVEQSENLLRLSRLDPARFQERFRITPPSRMENLQPAMYNAVRSAVNNNNDFHIQFNIPNVTNTEEFARFLQSGQATRYLREMIADSLMGKNDYHRYARKLF